MRTHGWGGDPPASDDEAIDRILAATRSCIDAKGSSTSITDVADHLKVTRQTIYRYFAGTEDLLRATAIDAAGEFMDRLESKVAHIQDPGSVVVEIVAYALERLPFEPYLGLLLTSERAGTFARGVTSTTAMAFGHSLFQRVNVDWEAAGITHELFDEFVEHVLRTVQSLVLDPGDPPRTGQALRQYLARWLWSPSAETRAIRVTQWSRSD
jgi:AcrR family transcriptional regulator